MDITIVHVADCPHVDLARRRLDAALDQVGLHATIHQRLVTSDHDTATAGLRGSPTILIDGHDPFDDDNETTGLACRLYRTEAGADGAPSVPDLVEALRRHGRRSPLERPLSDDLAHEIRWAAFERVRTGHAITTSELAEQLGAPPEKIAVALDELERAGLIERAPTDAIVGGHGLTLTPTRHHLVLDGIALHTWCALDAIGIPAALDTDAEITTPCGWCDRPLTLTVHTGTPEPAADMVLWLPRDPCTNVRQQFCPHANLHCDRDHLDRWRARAGEPSGDVLTVADATSLGRDWWGQTDRSDCCD
jgi:hypothetical protein